MMTDPIADMFARMRNALVANHETVEMPSSKMKAAIAKVLKQEGYIDSYRVLGDEKKPTLKIVLKYGQDGESVIREIKRVSRPGLRRYVGYRDIPRRFHGMGIHILSTPKGIVTDFEARKMKVGGEWVASVF